MKITIEEDRYNELCNEEKVLNNIKEIICKYVKFTNHDEFEDSLYFDIEMGDELAVMLKYCDRDFYNHLKEKMDAYKSQNKDEWER